MTIIRSHDWNGRACTRQAISVSRVQRKDAVPAPSTPYQLVFCSAGNTVPSTGAVRRKNCNGRSIDGRICCDTSFMACPYRLSSWCPRQVPQRRLDRQSSCSRTWRIAVTKNKPAALSNRLATRTPGLIASPERGADLVTYVVRALHLSRSHPATIPSRILLMRRTLRAPIQCLIFWSRHLFLD